MTLVQKRGICPFFLYILIKNAKNTSLLDGFFNIRISNDTQSHFNQENNNGQQKI
jgi:hypothetical protein